MKEYDWDREPSRFERAKNWLASARISGSPVEWIIMILYWFAVLAYGGYVGFTVVSLAVTMLVLHLLSKDGEGFVNSVTNNDWVMKTARMMLVVAAVAWCFDPTAPPGPPFSLNPFAWIGWLLKSSFRRSPMPSPFEEGGFWKTINSLLIGSGNDWKKVFFSCFWFALLAAPVSRWDDWKRRMSETKVSGDGSMSPLAKKFLGHLHMELLETPLRVAWWILKVPFKLLIGR